MKTLNKILLTGLIGAGSFRLVEKGYGQDKHLDSVINECNVQTEEIADSIKTNDCFVNEQLKTEVNYLIDSKRYDRIFFSEKIYSENLCINLNEEVYHVVKKNETDGIRDIIKINNGCEEAWLYLPEKQTWYEIGIFSDSTSVRPFTPRIKEILKENPDVTKLIFYHNHPGGYDLPSQNDLMMSVYIRSRFFKDYKIFNKIIAKDGEVIEYSLNNKGKRLSKNEFSFIFLDDVSKYFDINCTSIDLLDK